MNAEEMRVRRIMLADGRYLIIYEFVRSAALESVSKKITAEPFRSMTETKESGV